ncbi:hypothetical protein OG735_23975 [Streptomyces sp. NBC_01210]|uniref:hypothetical protein n=1 Tax=Streptomyces sp. NBC_01210 TaxID=2903774 RepID=UPI002E15C43A|nr:hypothetical protein OG735_23975 [Streptomyces sp. NBC_01210]
MSYASTDMVQLAANGDVFQWVKDTLGNIKTLAVSAATVMAIVATVMAYAKTKSWAGTLTAAILGAVVVFAVSNIDDLSNMVDSEVPDKKGSGPVSVVEVPQPLGHTVKQADLL